MSDDKENKNTEKSTETETTKTVSIRVPRTLLARTSKIRNARGIGLSWQMIKGLELWLDKNE